MVLICLWFNYFLRDCCKEKLAAVVQQHCVQVKIECKLSVYLSPDLLIFIWCLLQSWFVSEQICPVRIKFRQLT